MSTQKKKHLTFAELVSWIGEDHNRCVPEIFVDSVRKIQKVVLKREFLLNVTA
jgi:hypothetical protein